MFEGKAAEARVRRKARKLGWRVEKSRTRLHHVNDLGLYQLIDDRNRVRGGVDFDASLSDLEFWIDEASETQN